MISFNRKIVQLGFGAVGKSFFEKVFNEIKIDKNNYFVISRNKLEYRFFLELGGMPKNFIVAEINEINYKEILLKYLEDGDFLIDLADNLGTKDILELCIEKNIMYLNTGEADWPEHWYSIFEEYEKKVNLSKNYNIKYPIVLQHGNNPGLVSHFTKLGLEYIVKKQFRFNKNLKKLLKEGRFNEISKILDLKQIHVNDNDLQEIIDEFDEKKLYSTWCIDSFFFEMLSEATSNIGIHEKLDYEEKCNLVDKKNGFLEFKDIAFDKMCLTYYPNGKFNGYMVPHEETITISKSLQLEENGKIIYRPTVIFIYSPCELSQEYLRKSRIKKDYNKTENIEKSNNEILVRGFRYPDKVEILYKEKIKNGTEYVGVLLLGGNFNPVWVGNRIEKSFLYKKDEDSYWQTPTITPVAMSALAAACWMIENQEKGGLYFPDDIKDYKKIIKFAEKFISKTICKTFNKRKIEKELNINLEELQLNDIFTIN